MTPVTQRVPLFHQPVTGTFAGDGEAVQLAAETDGEVVMHHLRTSPSASLSILPTSIWTTAEVILWVQQSGELADELAAQRPRVAPRLERHARPINRLVDRQGGVDAAEGRSRDGTSRSMLAGGSEAGCPAGPQRGVGEGGEIGRVRKSHGNMLPRRRSVPTLGTVTA